MPIRFDVVEVCPTVPAPDGALLQSDLGVTVQPYNSYTVIDANYVQTQNNYSNAEKDKVASLYFVQTPVITSNYTALRGQAVVCDSGGGSFSITLPPEGPVRIIDIASNSIHDGFGANPVTLLPGVNTIVNGQTELILNAGGVIITLDLIAGDWRVIALEVPTLPIPVPWDELLITGVPEIPNIPFQGGNSGRFLYTDGTEMSWKPQPQLLLDGGSAAQYFSEYDLVFDGGEALG